MIKGVIFDMNGVIVDDDQSHMAAWNKALYPYGIQLSRQEYVDVCTGRPDNNCVVEIAELKGTYLPQEVLDDKLAYYLMGFPGERRLYEEVAELMNGLTPNYKLAIASSATRREINLVTVTFGISKYFDATVSINDVANGKPHPETFLKAASLLGVMPRECVVIEDAPNGVRAAKSADMKCIGLLTTSTRDVLLAAGVDSIADTHLGVATIIEGWNRIPGDKERSAIIG